MKPARNDSDETETKEQSPEVRPVQVENSARCCMDEGNRITMVTREQMQKNDEVQDDLMTKLQCKHCISQQRMNRCPLHRITHRKAVTQETNEGSAASTTHHPTSTYNSLQPTRNVVLDPTSKLPTIQNAAVRLHSLISDN